LCGSSGSNGKRTFLNLLRRVFGDYFETVTGVIPVPQYKTYRLLAIAESQDTDLKRTLLLPSQPTHCILASKTYICDPNIKTILFISKFVHPSVDRENHHLSIDPEIRSKFEILAPIFGSMLISRFVAS
jgi:hypothetical protein